MKTCPKCNAILKNYSFDGIITCDNCGWVDDTEFKMGIVRKKILTNPVLFKKYKELLEKVLQKEDINEIIAEGI